MREAPVPVALQLTKTETALVVILAFALLATGLVAGLVSLPRLVTGSPLIVSAAPVLLPVCIVGLLLAVLIERRAFSRGLRRFF
jgi:hypothetical protein